MGNGDEGWEDEEDMDVDLDTQGKSEGLVTHGNGKDGVVDGAALMKAVEEEML